MVSQPLWACGVEGHAALPTMRPSEAVSRSSGIPSTKGMLRHLVARDRAADACTRLCSQRQGQDHTTQDKASARTVLEPRRSRAHEGEGVWRHALPKPRGSEGWQAVPRKERWHT